MHAQWENNCVGSGQKTTELNPEDSKAEEEKGEAGREEDKREERREEEGWKWQACRDIRRERERGKIDVSSFLNSRLWTAGRSLYKPPLSNPQLSEQQDIRESICVCVCVAYSFLSVCVHMHIKEEEVLTEVMGWQDVKRVSF